MLTRMTIRRFKRFEGVEIELGSPVVFIGPNNSGKTSAMQALALWHAGLTQWNAKRGGKSAPEKRPGVTVNRRDLVSIPIPSVKLAWKDLRVRDVRSVGGKQQTRNIRIDIIVEGVTHGRAWKCGLEFDYANDESVYCRPLRLTEDRVPDRMPIPKEAESVRMAFLPPMSGLAAAETKLDEGAVNVRVGEGRTAEVLRNLCFRVHEERPDEWLCLVDAIRTLFGAELRSPKYIAGRGEIEMSYRERGIELDLSSTGRGLQQTLLLLAYMYAHPGAVLLLDEPDAHLEILRQRQTYRLLTKTAERAGGQIIAASHSEVLLNEAAGQNAVVAFVGTPHRIGNQPSQVLKSLQEIGFEQYLQAGQTGWVLYLEGSTDLEILRSFAARLGHDDARRALERPFVRYVGNQPSAAARHYFGLKEALPALRGIGIFDRLDSVSEQRGWEFHMWKRREIENYLCTRAALEAYAASSAEEAAPGPLFTEVETKKRLQVMKETIDEIESALRSLEKPSPWGIDLNVSIQFLRPLFAKYFSKLRLPNLMPKGNFHQLIGHMSPTAIDAEVSAKLDAIARIGRQPDLDQGETKNTELGRDKGEANSMNDVLDYHVGEDLMAVEESDALLPGRFVREVERILEPFGGRLGWTGVPSMGQPSDRIMYWVADVVPELRREALLALERADLWDRETGFQHQRG